ncbi:basic salivary proline-rich protein 3-like [Anser cygnoides]|uniref:basic salivary proline-rich protein 3-like n=1 Tax=Anser cygnoides TaxID=8845 RepID=UPI0034D21D6E
MTFFSRSTRICFFKSVNRRLICFDAGMSHRAAATHPLRAAPCRARGWERRGGGPGRGLEGRPPPARLPPPPASPRGSGAALGLRPHSGIVPRASGTGGFPSIAPPRPEVTGAKAKATGLSSGGAVPSSAPRPPPRSAVPSGGSALGAGPRQRVAEAQAPPLPRLPGRRGTPGSLRPPLGVAATLWFYTRAPFAKTRLVQAAFLGQPGTHFPQPGPRRPQTSPGNVAGSQRKEPPAAHGSPPEPWVTAPRRLRAARTARRSPPPCGAPAASSAAAPRTSAARGSRRCPQLPRGRSAQHHGQRAAELRQARRPPPLGGAAPQGSPAARPLPRAAAAGRRQPTPPADRGSARSFPKIPPAARAPRLGSSPAAGPRAPWPSLSPAPPLPSPGCCPRAPHGRLPEGSPPALRR